MAGYCLFCSAKHAKTRGNPHFGPNLASREKLTHRPPELAKFPMPAARHENKRNPAMGDLTKRHTMELLLIITICQLRATADVDGDIGRSSQLDHSKVLGAYFSELYRPSFLDPVKKCHYINKTARHFCMFSHGKRISARKSAFHRKVVTNNRCSFIRRIKLRLFDET